MTVGAAVGFAVLGIGGRFMMRIIAHWEGRVPVFTPGGTLKIVMIGTIAGVAAGIVYGILLRFVRNRYARNGAFLVFCVLFTLYGVKELLVRPKLLFVAITIVYCIIVALMMRRYEHSGVAKDLPAATA